ncbi:MAG: glycosyltransferase family 2 protein [Proteobacteria bacterium]|nr:glycosyltransferase family 2 protein [Pseudomonadota bacterium]MBU1453391.1 glycosyltransferase family 2 protein [Pseudomonadota bacterium]
MNTPHCSVIIVSFNKFQETTGPCLRSLQQDPTEIEIIVVDNGSDKQTCQALEQAAQEDSRIRLIFSKTNRGYAGGNNMGVEAAGSDILLLLNSDTQVLASSIPRCLSLMDENPDWSMLGPVSNQTGNDQQIFTEGHRPDEILAQGKSWCDHSHNFHYHTDILSFCCVMIRTKVYSELNGLDEAFGLGYYEDTDFNYRAAKAGLKLMITEDAFIYHRGSGSFSNTCPTVKKMVKQNKRLFRKKHGHGIIADHWRIKNLAAMERYVNAADNSNDPAGLQYKFRNRHKLASQLIPNSPLKKWSYFRRLKQVEEQFSSRFGQF